MRHDVAGDGLLRDVQQARDGVGAVHVEPHGVGLRHVGFQVQCMSSCKGHPGKHTVGPALPDITRSVRPSADIGTGTWRVRDFAGEGSNADA